MFILVKILVSMDFEKGGPDLENARTEYEVANNAYYHYDNFTWQVGAVLIAGAFVYWGFIFQANGSYESMSQSNASIESLSQANALYDSLSIGNFLITVIMSIWILYSAHNRQIYLYKLKRIHELEVILNMEQNLRFLDGHPKGYPRDSLKGHNLNLWLYVVVCLGSLLIAQSEYRWRRPELLPFVMIEASILVVSYVCYRVDRMEVL